MKFLKISFLFFIAFISLSTVSAKRVDAQSSSGFGRATFFQLPNYKGRSFVVYGTGSYSNLKKKKRGTGNWNNSIASVYIEGDMTVTLYENNDYNGPKITLTQSAASLDKVAPRKNWNYIVSSLSYKPKQQPARSVLVTFFENPGFSGRSFVLRANEGIADLNEKRRGNVFNDWNDEIESVLIDGNASVILYEDRNFFGDSIVLTGSDSDLWFKGWKKRASSLLILPN